MAAPHRGPSTLRTPRTQALDIGTDPRGFDNSQENYCPTCGIPVTGPHTHYVEQAPLVNDEVKPPAQPSPISK